MTNEEVIEVLENEESYMLSHGGDRQAKALRIAINKIKRDSNTKITIDEAVSNLRGILTEATENKNSVCYVTEDDAETLRAAIDTMRKYQMIIKILNSASYTENGTVYSYAYDEDTRVKHIREAVRDENDD